MGPLGEEKEVMKYMTPELLARFRSLDDAVSELAAAEWQRACNAYNEYLEETRSRLPRAVRSLLRRFCLHDARVILLGHREDGLSFSIFLKLDTPKDKGVQLTYELVEPPVGHRHPVLSDESSPLVWLYDEFEVREAAGEAFPTFWHSLLFTNGRELRLHFRELKLQIYEKVFSPMMRPLAEDGARGGLESFLK